LLDQIQRASSTRLVIVTGRGAREAASLLGLRGVEVWGLHGLERLHANGRHEIAKFDEQALQMVSEAKKLMLQDGLGDLLEFKQGSVAVHWRGIETAAKQVTNRVERIWRTLRRRDGLELMKFDGGMEIRVSGRNKGSAVRAILAEMGRHAAIAYLGDDYTDEDAFAALQGYGLSVLVRHAYRPTVADVWIRPPEGVTAFLSEWVTMCGGAS
jgi:trehalose-phosphatase